MSRIYLPNGGQIEVHEAWTSESLNNGGITYFKKDSNKTFLGEFSQGVIHLTNSCKHTYYPPVIHNIGEAARLVQEHIRQLKTWELRQLKHSLLQFDSKKGEWK